MTPWKKEMKLQCRKRTLSVLGTIGWMVECMQIKMPKFKNRKKFNFPRLQKNQEEISPKNTCRDEESELQHDIFFMPLRKLKTKTINLHPKNQEKYPKNYGKKSKTMATPQNPGLLSKQHSMKPAGVLQESGENIQKYRTKLWYTKQTFQKLW